MASIGRLKFKRTPEPVRRRLEMAGAAAWEAVVDTHANHAAGFVALLRHRLPFDQAVERYLTEMDVRDPMASAIRSRVLTRLEALPDVAPPTPDTGADEGDGRKGGKGGKGGEGVDGGEGGAPGGLKRFRPDVVAKGIARKVRETEALEEWIRLAIARAEEGVLQAHIDNAVSFTDIVRGHLGLDEGVEDYLDLMRITGGRAQSVYQRTMARLADIHLPSGTGPSPAAP
jgi:hypothetical protein